MGLCWHLPVPRWFTGLQCGYPWFIMDVPCVLCKSIYRIYIIYVYSTERRVFHFHQFSGQPLLYTLVIIRCYSKFNMIADLTLNEFSTFIKINSRSYSSGGPFFNVKTPSHYLNGRVPPKAGATYKESNWNPYQTKIFFVCTFMLKIWYCGRLI